MCNLLLAALSSHSVRAHSGFDMNSFNIRSGRIIVRLTYLLLRHYAVDLCQITEQ